MEAKEAARSSYTADDLHASTEWFHRHGRGVTFNSGAGSKTTTSEVMYWSFTQPKVSVTRHHYMYAWHLVTRFYGLHNVLSPLVPSFSSQASLALLHCIRI